MNVHAAIGRAADHIERNPGGFHFACGSTPDGPFGVGCALGWISYFLGHRCGPFYVGISALELDGDTPAYQTSLFYLRMESLARGGVSWTDSPARCAQALRRYAEQYHAVAAEPAPQDRALAA